MSSDTLINIVLIAASLSLVAYCFVLAGRLKQLNNLETGLGGAIAVMAAEVDRLEQTIQLARDEATSACTNLEQQIEQARKERAIWELRQTIDVTGHDRVSPRRLRKRNEVTDA